MSHAAASRDQAAEHVRVKPIPHRIGVHSRHANPLMVQHTVPRFWNRPPAGDILDQVDLIDPPGGISLRLRFEGPFEGRQVVWNATLRALGSSRGDPGQSGASGNFIEVGEDTADGILLTIGLAVDRIDLPTVHKAVIMIRRFKRLRRGRHQW
jgi:hypothetical protein